MADPDFNPSSQDVADYLKSKSPSAFQQLAPGIGTLLAPGLAKGAAVLAGKISPMLSALFLSNPVKSRAGWNYHKILDDKMNEVGRSAIRPQGSDLFVHSVSAWPTADHPLSSDRPNIFGPAEVRGLLRSLKSHYPNAETVSGFRISGARMGPAAKDYIDDPNWEDKLFTSVKLPSEMSK